jgi:gluconokinase
VTIGTSSAFRVITEDVAPPPPGLFRYRLDRHRALVGGALSAGGNLHAWLERTLRLPDTPTVAERPPSAHGLTFLPSLGGERSPTWDADARGAVAGLTFETSPLDLLQAGLEAVAYGLAEIAERLPGVEEVVATGGALHASSDWTQILADVLERPVIASPVAEASARGAAVYALERLGLDASEPPPGEPVLPRLDRADAHRAARARLVQLRTDLSGRA